MSEHQQVAVDEFVDLIPNRMWIGVTTIGVRAEGMVRVVLEVNGKEKDLYHGYVHDGTVSHWSNLTVFLNRPAERAAEDKK